MGAVIIDGRGMADEILGQVKKRTLALNSKGILPHLAVIIAGEDPASQVYVRNKEKACADCGIVSTIINLPVSSRLEDVVKVIDDLNGDDSIHGILVQSPAPGGIDEIEIARNISRTKDVDGFHPENLGGLVQGVRGGLVPCTPSGVMRMLEISGADIEGSRALVIGRSRIVGMPMSLMLAQKGADATVTIAHSMTPEIGSLCREADILVSAIGKAGFVKPDWVKPGSFLIDVGISRTPDGKIVGDFSPGVFDVAGWVTPVPGGVGPMTIAMLMENTVIAAEKEN
ncbi:MAG TPA: bifunctional 5,10-methylenetetrahydrofolate dehydrogenase/5,10-methenyltetrahydrofolate cyclohydrolase [Candidatus Thalassarchaeaceae archaeon]|nr:bifunctional 5,10-methylenetetrahydrofolate dehydrogenase/5,10-methenyltetrahydrofolate cyclohydrolase [Candidatus Thalassarchaeaceae archaeon]